MIDEQNQLPPISLVDLARITGFSPSSIKKVVLARNFIPFRFKETQNATWYITGEDAELFKQRIEDEKRLILNPSNPNEISTGGVSAVYALHIPSFTDQQRLKLGWSDNLQERLSTHRGLVPDLKIMALWLTGNAWLENMALMWAKAHGKQIGAEVFEFDDIQGAVSRLDRLFAELGVSSQLDIDDDDNDEI